MRRCLVFALLVALRPDVAAAAPRCQTSGKTLMASAQVRVFRTWGSVYACWVARARVRRLGVPARGADGDLVAVAGRWVTWSTEACEFDETCAFTVHVLDVRKGHRARARVPDAASTTALVLDRWGIPAWIEQAAGTRRVVARSRPGARHVLADHPDIHPRSLAVARSYVYWTQDGVARKAPLP